MKREDFLKLELKDKIEYVNKELLNGKTVSEIRKDLNVSKKSMLKQFKDCYVYDRKTKQYIKDDTNRKSTESITESITSVEVIDTRKNNKDKESNAIAIKDKENLTYLNENIEILKQMVQYYKTTICNTENVIVINLLNDKNQNQTPRSIRVNEYVWKDWQKFCNKNKDFNKKDLISMALKEYMEKYQD